MVKEVTKEINAWLGGLLRGVGVSSIHAVSIPKLVMFKDRKAWMLS